MKNNAESLVNERKEIRGTVTESGTIKTKLGEVTHENVSKDLAGKNVVVRGDTVTERFDS